MCISIRTYPCVYTCIHHYTCTYAPLSFVNTLFPEYTRKHVWEDLSPIDKMRTCIDECLYSKQIEGRAWGDALVVEYLVVEYLNISAKELPADALVVEYGSLVVQYLSLVVECQPGPCC